MNFESDTIETGGNKPEVLAQRVAVILRALEKLSVDVEATEVGTVDGVNKLTIDLMDEPAVAQYLQGFLLKIQANEISLEEIHAHTMFQAVLAKARAIENGDY